MENYPKLDLTKYDGYDPSSIARADDDLMREVYGAPPLPSWNLCASQLSSSPFGEILANTIDKDEDYQRVRDEELTSPLDCICLGLILARQPLVLIEDLPI